MTRLPNPLNSPSLALPACILTLLAILAYRSGWFWFVVLCGAVAAAPWFAASRLLDRIGELEAEGERRDRAHAAEAAGLEQDVTDLTAALAESTATLADARVVVPLKPVLGPNVIPMQRTATHDHLAEDDDWFSRLYDDKGDLR